MWGAFAERVLVPRNVVARGLRRIPDGLAPEAAALLDPLASVVRGLSRCPWEEDATWLVYGSGPIALLFAVLRRRAGAGRVLVAGRRAERLLAFEPFGAETIDVTRDCVAEAVAKATAGRGADVVVEATGDAAVAASCVSLAAKGGTVLLFAGSGRDATIPLVHARVHYDEVSVVGSFHYTPEQASEALVLLEERVIPVASVVTSRRPLAEWAEAFESMTSGADLKVALVP